MVFNNDILSIIIFYLNSNEKKKFRLINKKFNNVFIDNIDVLVCQSSRCDLSFMRIIGYCSVTQLKYVYVTDKIKIIKFVRSYCNNEKIPYGITKVIYGDMFPYESPNISKSVKHICVPDTVKNKIRIPKFVKCVEYIDWNN